MRVLELTTHRIPGTVAFFFDIEHKNSKRPLQLFFPSLMSVYCIFGQQIAGQFEVLYTFQNVSFPVFSSKIRRRHDKKFLLEAVKYGKDNWSE